MYYTGGYYDEIRGQFRWRTKEIRKKKNFVARPKLSGHIFSEFFFDFQKSPFFSVARPLPPTPLLVAGPQIFFCGFPKNLAHETPWNGAWDVNEPHISLSNCVGARYTNALLQDRNCGQVKHYMCEISRGKLVCILLNKDKKSNTLHNLLSL